MAPSLDRRAAFGLAGAAGAMVALGAASPALAKKTANDPVASDASGARKQVAKDYKEQTKKAKGTWNSYITIADTDGTLKAAVDDKSDVVVEAYSVNKIAVAAAVLDKVDRGQLALDTRVDVTKDIVIPDGDGIFRLDGAYPSSVTLGHVLANLLTVSDDTAVRLCGSVCPAKELNEILKGKGFVHTQVEPVANPNRFFLGKTTPKETHEMLRQLAAGTLLSETSCAVILKLLRAPVAFTDGIRRTMSSDERARVATKAGWFDDGRNEAGIMFDKDGKPVLTYSIFAHGQEHADDFGSTHPAVEARAVIGRKAFTAISKLGAPTLRMTAPLNTYRPSNGG
ncbi:MAG: serine hydrolase [Corynebacteriales bacterium]|nr:serine hydrolase [Mycobacteriales bacterium]